MKKRILSIALVFVLTIAMAIALTACGGNDNEGEGKGENQLPGTQTTVPATTTATKEELIKTIEDAFVGKFTDATVAGNYDIAISGNREYNSGGASSFYIGHIMDATGKAQINNGQLYLYEKASMTHYYDSLRQDSHINYMESYIAGNALYYRTNSTNSYYKTTNSYLTAATGIANAALTGDIGSYLSLIASMGGLQLPEGFDFGDLDFIFSNLFDEIETVLNGFGITIDLNGKIFENSAVSETADGYTLNIFEDDYAGMFETYKQQIKDFATSTVDSLLKTYLDLDVKKTFNDLKTFITPDFTLDDIVNMLVAGRYDLAITADNVYALADLCIAGLSNKQISTKDYADYTIDDFILEISDGNLDYADVIGIADSSLDKYLNKTVCSLIDAFVSYNTDTESLLSYMDTVTATKGVIEFVFNFDKDKKLIGATASCDVAAQYNLTDSYGKTTMDFALTGSAVLKDIGSTNIVIPTNIII